ncbi:hypothetical protein QSV08_11625 [Maribacter sp. BPC-D8]|uniref:hypothetical protein n=1 Tax=Maribacter sp. BPC-D8 TaxID=3053613 RepID=UPI002B4A08DF|nr:hypothetical protein [Maribacter sp. BPC-D8]WRI27873.1 hypothetical protein QSV08_11625 [Maribacter sp. BPC-D8]
MEFDKLLFEKSLDIIGIGSTKKIIKVTDKTLDFFKSIGLSAELIDFLKEFSFMQGIDFDGIYFSRVNDMRSENLEEINKEIFKYNLLIVGAGMNGDPIVLNFKTMKMGYVFHDELWEGDTIEDLDAIFIDLGLSLGEFYYKKVTEENFPIDAYEAEEYMNNLKK